MRIKIHTLIKGVVWELIGVLILSAYIWWKTGSFYDAYSIGLGYSAFRAILWYPYERLFKHLRRKYRTFIEIRWSNEQCRKGKIIEVPIGKITKPLRTPRPLPSDEGRYFNI